MGLRKLIGATILGAALYASGVLTSNKAEDMAFYARHRGAQIEQGYCTDFGKLDKERVINQKGNVETYFVDGQGSLLPVYDGQISIQVGNDWYALANIPEQRRVQAIKTGYDGLTTEKGKAALELSDKVWDGLDETQRVNLVLDNYGELSQKSQAVLADSLLGKCYSNKWEYFKKTMSNWWDGITNREDPKDGIKPECE